MSEYTAEDFAQAMFAEHPDPDAVDARYAARMNRDPEFPWLLDGVPGNGDEHMARDGWVPVVESRVTEGTLRHVEERAERKRQKLIAHIESVEAAVRDRNRTIEELYVARQEASRRESAAHDRVVTLLDTKKTHEQAISDLRHDLEVAQKEMADLRQERDRLEGQLVVAGEQIESRRLVIENLLEENYRLDAKADGAISLDALEAAWEAAEVPTDDAPIREGDVVIYTSACGTGVTVHKAAVGQFGRETHGYVRVLSRAPREPWADLADLLRARLDDGVVRVEVDWAARELHAAGVRVTGGDEK